MTRIDFKTGTFYLGDCFDVMSTISPGGVDMVLTDVPYNAVNRKSSGLRNLDKGIADSAEFDMGRLISDISHICGGSVYVFCGWEQVSDLAKLVEAGGFSVRAGIWEKNQPFPHERGKIMAIGR